MNQLNNTQLHRGPNFDYNCYLFTVVVLFVDNQIVSHKPSRLGDDVEVHLRFGNASGFTIAKE